MLPSSAMTSWTQRCRCRSLQEPVPCRNGGAGRVNAEAPAYCHAGSSMLGTSHPVAAPDTKIEGSQFVQDHLESTAYIRDLVETHGPATNRPGRRNHRN